MQRIQYDDLIKKHVIDPRNIEGDVNAINPLMKKQDNPWNKYFENQELEKLIQLDLERLYPEYPFFSTENVQKMLKRCLFIWSKENPDPSYRQGMHELLANVFLVLHREVKSRDESTIHFSEKKELAILLDKEFLEHDTYVIFEKMMQKMKTFFQVNLTTKKGKGFNSKDSSGDRELIEQEMIGNDTHIIEICQKIQNHLLKKRDPVLSNHLMKLKIEPQIYGLRWIRLLFGREFEMEDVLVIWDAIFSECQGQKLKSGELIHLDLMEHMAVSMLVYVGRDLKDLDYNECLTTLLRFPKIDDVFMLIADALTCSKNDYQSFNPHHYDVKKSDRSLNQGIKQDPKKVKVKPLPGLMESKNLFGEDPKTISEHEKQIKIGLQMEKIINILQVEFMSADEMRDQVSVSVAIAELKVMKDILKGQIPFDESLFHDYSKLKEINVPKKIQEIKVETKEKSTPVYEITLVTGNVGLN